MPSHLHLLKPDAPPLAAAVIEADARAPGAVVTVVLLDRAVAPALPPGVRVLTQEALGSAGLLDLIFESDRIVTW